MFSRIEPILAAFDLEKIRQPEVFDCLFKITDKLLRLRALEFKGETEPKFEIDAGLQFRDQSRSQPIPYLWWDSANDANLLSSRTDVPDR